MNTEKYHSLAAYDIYLIAPGCESPVELKRCREAVQGQLCTRALPPLVPNLCWRETQTPLGSPRALSSALSHLRALQSPQHQPAPPGFTDKELNA